MPALIRQPRAPGKLQAAALKADKAIQNLLNDSDADSEAVGVLVAHYEELKRRYQHLKDFEKSQSEESELDDLEEPLTTEPRENQEEDEQTSTQPVYLDQLEDGTFKFTLPPKEPDGKPEVYILNSDDYDNKNPINNVLITASELIRIAAGTIVSHASVQLLRESQLEFLSNAQENLLAQKNKIDLLLGSEGSPLAIEIAVNFYLDDALRYFRSCQLMLQALGIEFDAAHDMESRFYVIKQTDLE